MLPLQNLGENLWVHEDTMPMIAGARLRLRMTIVKLTNGGLWIHSPTALSDELKSKVETLGPVNFIIGPSNGHNLWLREWQKAYPKASLHVSFGVVKKLALKNVQVLDESHDNIWQSDLVRVYMQGAPFFNESVFFHPSTKSLIVTDLIQNHSDDWPAGLPGFLWRFIFAPLGFSGQCVAPPLKLGFMIKDKQAFASCISRIQDWDFERIIVTHGDIIKTNAKRVFADLCQRFLDEK